MVTIGELCTDCTMASAVKLSELGADWPSHRINSIWAEICTQSYTVCLFAPKYAVDLARLENIYHAAASRQVFANTEFP